MRRSAAISRWGDASTTSSSVKRKRGEENDSSAWADHALATLGRGAMSVSELQQSAAAMVKECGGNCSSMTRAIAQLGCHGRYPANCERDLFRLLDLPIEPFFIKIPVRDRSKVPGASRRVVQLRVPIILPHEILHYMFTNGKVKISREDIRAFCSHWETNKPYHVGVESKSHCPLGLGGDDAKYTLSGAKVVVIVLNLPLWDQALQSTKATSVDSDMSVNRRFLIAAVRHEICLKGNKTLDPIFRVMAWSLNVAYSGVFPSRDWKGRDLPPARSAMAGKPIAGGPFCLVQVRGDWKWLWESWQMKHYWKHKKGICFKCRADAEPGPNMFTRFDDFESIPRLTTRQFFDVALKRYICPISFIACFQPSMLKYCLMHTMHLGLLHNLNAGGLLTLVECGWFGDRSTSVSPTHMEIFTFRFHTWCRLHGINHSQPWITKGHLNLTDYAELRLKAFASRIMTSFLAVVLTNLQREKSCVGQSSVDLDLVALATTQFSNWSLLVEEYPHALSNEQADKLYHDGRKFLKTYKLLAIHHVQLGNRRYPLKPKAHVFLEIIFEARVFKENPRGSHTYMDEDFMGQMKRLARSVHRQTLEMRCVLRWLLRVRHPSLAMQEDRSR